MGVIHGRAGAVPSVVSSLDMEGRGRGAHIAPCSHTLFPPPSRPRVPRKPAVKSTAPVGVCTDSARVTRRIRMPRTNPVQANGAGVLHVLHPRAGDRELRAQPTRARRVGVHLHGYIPCRSRVRMPFHTHTPRSHAYVHCTYVECNLPCDIICGMFF
ncbi:hypothetical protein C8F04DRAFT_1105822, partial [Mycena alexandri]